MPSKRCRTRAESSRLSLSCWIPNCFCRSGIRGRDCRLGMLTRSFLPSSPPSRKAAGWGWPSVVPLWSRMVGSCGQAPTMDEVQPFISLCRPTSRSHRAWLPLFLELGVLGFGLSIDGKVGVGIFPNAKEFFVRFAGGRCVAHHLLRAAELEPGQGPDDMSHAKTGSVDQLLELSRGRLAIAEAHVRESADVGGVHGLERSR